MSYEEDEKKHSGKAMKVIKMLGKLLSVVAIVYVVKRMVGMDIPIEQLASAKSIVLLVLLVIYQTVKLFTGCLPWRCFIQAFSHKEIPHKQTAIVYIKSNILKYVPGNVFQYIGRNELAVKLGIPHASVATATIFDVGVNFAVAVLIALCLMGKTAWDYLKQNGQTLLLLIGVFVVLLIIFVILSLKLGWAERILQAIKSMTWSDAGLIGKAIAYYCLLNLLGSVQFLLICFFMLGIRFNIGEAFYLSGANVLSFVIGFITPGASGGIGVREGVMILLTSDMMPGGMIAFAMVISRIIGIAGDVLAYLVVRVMEWRVRCKNGMK